MHIHTEHTPPGPRAGPRHDIEGWGVDLADADRPAYPKERTPQRLVVPWAAPEHQPLTVEVLHSNERPGLTPVFGTTLPPKGISGMLRRLAFRASENDIRHWLVLLLADRVNVVEGITGDLLRGHVPNVFAEMGGAAALRHNPRGVARKLLVIAGFTAITIGLIALRQRRRALPRK